MNRQQLYLLCGAFLCFQGCAKTDPAASLTAQAEDFQEESKSEEEIQELPFEVPRGTTLSGSTMGTTYSITYVGEIDAAEDEIQQRVEAALAQVNDQMSTYLPNSELSRFNESRSTEPQQVSPATAFVVQQAIAIHERTGGAFDVTVGPLIRLWKLNDPRSAAVQLTRAEIKAAREKTGTDRLQATISPPTIGKDVPDLELDLSAIAKGYGVDRVCEVLSELGMKNYLVEIGGEVRTSGRRSVEDEWSIGVEGPHPEKRELSWIVDVEDAALASSGDYRNFRGNGDSAYTHIVDPRTGKPLPYRGVAVTVVAETCLEADALATALLVMGEIRGYEWCEQRGVAALFQTTDSDGAIDESVSTAFRKLRPVKLPPDLTPFRLD